MTSLRSVPEPSEALRLRVAAEVRAWRGRLGYSQEYLARVLGVSQGSISAKLNGKTPISLDEIDLLAALFRVRPAALLGTTDEAGGPPPAPHAPEPTPSSPDGGSTAGLHMVGSTPGDHAPDLEVDAA